MTGSTWYVVHTGARAELQANNYLRAQGYDTLYLHFPATVKHANRKIGVIKPYFPRYLFVGVYPGQSIGVVNKTPGVSTVVYFGDEPMSVPDAVMAEMRSIGDANGKIAPKEPEERERLRKSREVRIMGGAFEGFLATVEKDAGDAVRVWVSIFGRPTAVTVAPGDLAAA